MLTIAYVQSYIFSRGYNPGVFSFVRNILKFNVFMCYLLRGYITSGTGFRHYFF